jgi:sialate O-acetylesterase
MPIRSGLMLWILALAATAHAEPPALLHPLFQDHAVLQRDRPVRVWGHAAAGEAMSVSLGSANARATADGSGRWSAVLPPLSAGGPFVLTAEGSSGTRQAVNDILVGDVYLCSGQSNMELRGRPPAFPSDASPAPATGGNRRTIDFGYREGKKCSCEGRRATMP